MAARFPHAHTTARNSGLATAATGEPTHATLLDLLACGLTYAEARALPYEDALCLLHVQALRRRLAQLDAEAARLASLPLADPHAVVRELRRVQLKANAIMEEKN